MFDRLPLPSQLDRVILAGGAVAGIVATPILVVLLGLLFSDVISGPEFVFYLAATVVIGGLVTSTLLTSIVIPCIYPWFARGLRRVKLTHHGVPEDE